MARFFDYGVGFCLSFSDCTSCKLVGSLSNRLEAGHCHFYPTKGEWQFDGRALSFAMLLGS